MCGIFGYYNYKDLNDINLKAMGEVIHYRGPDEYGEFIEPNIGLGNVRLSIIDLENGSQPFYSDDQMIVVVQNGEIFNHVELADELKLTDFKCRTNSDTEVILRLYEIGGISELSKLNGMFAIAIYDKNIGSVFLVRDRVGEKPLYYTNSCDQFIFASEIKSILSCGVERTVDKDALDLYLALNYVPPPKTIFKNIFALQPGHYIEINKNGISEVKWWDLSSIVTEVNRSEEYWISKLIYLLEDSVRIRLRADVSFGAFLSGGVDSSTIVGLMARNLDRPVQTFSIGFIDPRYDESAYAEEAALRFGTIHKMERVESNLTQLWSKFIYHCDQPHGDVSFMPTYKLSELAAKNVKMVLTGDGADEIFAGYEKYQTYFSSNDKNTNRDFEQFLKHISLFTEEQRMQLYKSKKEAADNIVNTKAFVKNTFDKASQMDPINQVLYFDTQLLLSGNNLVKPDRMGMAFSIENRAPFLDYRVVELAFKMPGDLKLKDNETKYIYKKAVEGLIGKNLAHRKKQMFTVPIGSWLTNELAFLVKELLFSGRFEKRGLFDIAFIELMYKSHCDGTENFTRQIRALMSLELWFREFIDIQHVK